MSGRRAKARPDAHLVGTAQEAKAAGSAARTAIASSPKTGTRRVARPSVSTESPLPPEIERLLATLQARWPQRDTTVVERAYRLAEIGHSGQKRLSGEPYVSHSIAVAQIVTELGGDPDVVAAALLHDVLEDAPDRVTPQDIEQMVGRQVLDLVTGLTKLEADESEADRSLAAVAGGQRLLPKERQEAEAIQRLFTWATRDTRVLLLKIADRLHNMRTVQWLPEDRRRALAEQTERIYAPLADRLGLWPIKSELEDLALAVLEPKVYAVIDALVKASRADNERCLAKAIDELDRALRRAGLQAELSGRIKHYASIYRKMQRYGLPISRVDRLPEEIRDILALRVVLDEEDQCWRALGVVHATWQPIEGTFDDYISRPKANGYRSLHTSVIGPEQRILEVQIRTHEMHAAAEFGIGEGAAQASHWHYKRGHTPGGEAAALVEQLRRDLQEALGQKPKDLDELVQDVLSDQVQVMTPGGESIRLPNGATPIDLAYAIHTELGHRCRGAIVNGRVVALNTPLKNGQVVRIIPAEGDAGPDRDWLNPALGYAVTVRARTRIRQWFRRQEPVVAARAGREVLERQLRKLGMADTPHETVARLFGYSDCDEFYVALGRCQIEADEVSQRLLQREEQSSRLRNDLVTGDEAAETLESAPRLSTRVARCCMPAPGETVLAYMTRRRGRSLHRPDCANIRTLLEREPERFTRIVWQPDQHEGIPVPLRIVAYDRAGLVRDISEVIAGLNISMSSVSAVANPVDGTATVVAVIRVPSLPILGQLLDRLELVENVIEVQRPR